MSKATSQDLIEQLKETITDNLDDPNPDRNVGRDWVQTTPVNYQIDTNPRIHIHKNPSDHEALSIGRTEREKLQGIQINFFHSTGEGYNLDIDDDGELEQPYKVLDYLVNEIETIVNSNQDVWCNLGDNIWSVVTVTDRPLETEKNSMIGHVLELELRYNS